MRLKNHIGKAQRHRVLHCFFAKVMVNPVDLMLIKYGSQFIVDRA